MMVERTHKPRLTPKELVRGTRWRYKIVPAIVGVVDSIHAAGYVHLVIDDEFGEFTWKSTIQHFLERWEKVDIDTISKVSTLCQS